MGDRLVETHCSTVFLVGDRVYKRKKPLDLGFVDFRTVDGRRRACEAEVALNRRLAPGVYLGVATLLGPDGRPCDSLVVMRRLPDDRRLARCVAQGEEVQHALVALAARLAALHRGSPAPAALRHLGLAPSLRELWETGLDGLRAHAEAVPSAVRERTRELAADYLAGRGRLLAQRVARGRVVDGHGDLLADDVFLLEAGPCALDCLEFDERLRVGDGLADAAFLTMDLERLGRADLGRAFLDAYLGCAGDAAPWSLQHHYVAYRAHIRSKVACVRYAQTGDPADAAQGRALADLALSHLERGRVVLVLVGGVPGSGKSTLAEGLAAAQGFRRLSSDAVRDELVPTAGAPARPHEGRYAPAARDAVYAALLAQAEGLLGLGESVVLDATFTSARWRQAARETAARAVVPVVELRCVVPEGVADRRVLRRPAGASEATPAVRAALAADREPWPEAVDVDTRPDPGRVLEGVLAWLPPRGPRAQECWSAPGPWPLAAPAPRWNGDEHVQKGAPVEPDPMS